MGFDVTHLYGLTECYGPRRYAPGSRNGPSLPSRRARRELARQGVRHADGRASRC